MSIFHQNLFLIRAFLQHGCQTVLEKAVANQLITLLGKLLTEFASCCTKTKARHLWVLELPLWLSWSRIYLQVRRPRFNPWVGEDFLEKGKATHSSILA